MLSPFKDLYEPIECDSAKPWTTWDANWKKQNQIVNYRRQRMDDGVFHQVSNETLDVMYKRSSKPFTEKTHR